MGGLYRQFGPSSPDPFSPEDWGEGGGLSSCRLFESGRMEDASMRILPFANVQPFAKSVFWRTAQGGTRQLSIQGTAVGLEFQSSGRLNHL